jgi:DNA-binding NarL/FixJ family response regulator
MGERPNGRYGSARDLMRCGVLDERARRVWIDDRNAIFRRGLRSALVDAAFDVVGESEAFSPAPDVSDVDIVIFDLEYLQRAVLAAGGQVRLVGVAESADEESLLDAIDAGVVGFLVREALTPEALIGSLEAVANGAGSMPSDLVKRLFGVLARGGRAAVTGALGRREVDVLRLLAGGCDTREIAAELSYSERTVKNIVHDVLVKLDCRTRAEAVGVATRRGVI